MKKLLALALVAALVCLVTGISAEENEQSFHVEYAMYDGIELFGSVEIPDGTYFIRAAFFLRDGTFFVVIVPISREGLFQLPIAVNCACAVISIVDSPSAIIPGQGTIYKTEAVKLIQR